jgi:hypothetical protein
MAVELKSHVYNYYNVQGRYSPATPEKASWIKLYEDQEDSISSNNYNKDSEQYKALVKLEDTYYELGVSNRARYSSYDELQTALAQKYLYKNSPYAGKYTYEERRAMYDNELSMSAFGHCGNMSDPRLNGPVHGETDSERKTYNRQAVNQQICSIFAGNGISQSMLAGNTFTFTINPYTYELTVDASGDTDQSLVSNMEDLLNQDRNAKELFFHILKGIGSNNINQDVMAKYKAGSLLREYADLDIRDFTQTEDGLVDQDGKNILDLFAEAIRSTSKVPAAYKGVVYDNFEEQIAQITAKEVDGIQDLYLSIGYENGELKDLANSSVVRTGLEYTV